VGAATGGAGATKIKLWFPVAVCRAGARPTGFIASAHLSRFASAAVRGAFP
jgi:hypothetical protein